MAAELDSIFTQQPKSKFSGSSETRDKVMNRLRQERYVMSLSERPKFLLQGSSTSGSTHRRGSSYTRRGEEMIVCRKNVSTGTASAVESDLFHFLQAVWEGSLKVGAAATTRLRKKTRRVSVP